MSRRHLIKSTGVIGFATSISRLLGFVRDIVIANFFGTGAAAQAFFVAFRIPNSLRDLVGEGAANAAIVPVLTEYRTLKTEREFVHASRVLFNLLFTILSALALAGILLSPLIVRLIAPGFIQDPAVFDLTVTLNRIIFPYLILIGLTAYTMGVLNTLRHFAAPAFGPCLMNVALIASALWLCPRFGVYGLAAGVLAGGVLQLGLNIPVMYRNGISISFTDGIRHPAVQRIGRLLIPRALGSAVYQVNIFVDTILASFSSIVGAGGVAALYYANRLIQLPLAVFGVAIAQAALPKMSAEFAAGDIPRLRETVSFSLRAVFLVMIPASVGLALLGKPIIRILFQRGEFTAYSSAITYSALAFYTLGIFAYSGVKIMVSCFYSMHDTKTPVKTAFAAVILNIVLNLILMWPLKIGGLALATALSEMANFTVLAVILQRRLGGLEMRAIADSFLKTVLASVGMGIALALIAPGPSAGPARLFTAIGVGIAVFIAVAYLINVREVREASRWISARR